jgi:hypothetical protein
MNPRHRRVRRCIGVLINVGGLLVLVGEVLSLTALW